MGVEPIHSLAVQSISKSSGLGYATPPDPDLGLKDLDPFNFGPLFVQLGLSTVSTSHSKKLTREKMVKAKGKVPMETRAAGSLDAQRPLVAITTSPVSASRSRFTGNTMVNTSLTEHLNGQQLHREAQETDVIETQVFPCVSATCGHFYHPECVARLLHPGNRDAAEQLQKKIASGESFTCPVHKCLVCKQGENKKVHELQFAICRRCPKAYHRQCLPRKIAFDDLEEENIVQRAWDGLMPNRILIYCLKHKIDEEIGTPVRDHITFPYVERRRNRRPLELQSSKEKFVTKKRTFDSEDSLRERIALKTPKQVEKAFAIKEGDSLKKRKKSFSGQGFDSSKKPKTADASRKSLKDNIKYFSAKVGMSSAADESKVSFREEKLTSLFSKGSEPEKFKQKGTSSNKLEKTVTAKLLMKKSSSSLPLLDAETEKRIVSLMKDSSSSITLEEIVGRHKVPSTHAYSSKSVVDKTITQGRVEGSVEAVRTALQKLEEGCSIEDAKANKLKVYLAPFLHGMRYTSFGRHFTKVDKLKEGNANCLNYNVQIVDKLHCYVQNGDMIVDFCCGANDFSCLMKEKLEETGKKCSFKNYDVIQPKNDFNFEKRDWMSVRQKELPTGSQLIMGLNPPFGVKAALANKFIDKALEFKPKLLILIVPKETERLNEKEASYDLVWEDNEKLSGKSFYLPGSVDVNDKQMDQWNVKPPLLYLWSRPDWTARHKIIAQKHGHISKGQKNLPVEENPNGKKASDHPTEVANDYYGNFSKPIKDYGDFSKAIEDPFEKKDEKEETEVTRAIEPKEQKESSLPNNGDREGRKNHGPRKKRSLEIPKERQDKGKLARGKVETPPEEEQDGGRPAQASEMFNGTTPLVSSPFNRADPGILLDGHPSEVLETPSARPVSEESFWRFQHDLSGSGSHFGMGYGGNRTSITDDIARRYGLKSEDPFAGGTYKWPTETPLAHDYGVRGLEEQFPGYMKDNMESFGRKPYIDELDEKYRREAETRLQLPLYGRQDLGTGTSSLRSSYLPNQDPGFSQVGSLSSTNYGHLGSAADLSYNRMNSSTMQRYAPRLDELNHTRTSSLGPETPLMGRSGIYDTPGSRPGLRTDSLGFAPGPQHPFSQHNSSGWLNE
ncbi:hypothetical protein HHK36_002191 [Tetracentron sinense]|uniref:Protein ENHANCED DOWNY MILDEW 2 n=1 Tax=Tetracentron sinense TaxID=13715 RepID=A0A834ZXR5_TETSI|nr:hypothetical protein HHK36_002191 [Tetracentron sinense]